MRPLKEYQLLVWGGKKGGEEEERECAEKLDSAWAKTSREQGRRAGLLEISWDRKWQG